MKTLFTTALLILTGLIYGQYITPDSTFGTNGVANLPYNQLNPFKAWGMDLKQQSDGKFVVCGEAYLNTGYITAMTRYNTDGSLDHSFGYNGLVLRDLLNTVAHLSDVSPIEMVIQNDDKIVIAGIARYSYNDTDFFYQTLAARFNSNGTSDSSFGDFGIKTLELNDTAYEYATSVGLQSDGKIVMAVFTQISSDGYLVLRLNSNGSIDSTFGTNGITPIPSLSGNNMELKVQPDDKIVLAGKAGNEIMVVRLLADGYFDSGFGTNGIVMQAISPVINDFHALALQPDGKILIGGSGKLPLLPSPGFAALARLNSNGTPDSSFNGNGLVLESINGDSASPHNDIIYKIAVQDDGKILVGGHMNINAFPTGQEGMMFARFNTDGSRDYTFSANGYSVINFTEYGVSRPGQLLLLPGGKFATLLQDDGHYLSPKYNYAMLMFKQQVATDIATLQENKVGMIIAPNPLQANSTLQFELTTPELLSAGIYDIQGRKVATLFENKMHTAGKYIYSIGNLLPAHGAYLVQLQGNNLQLNAKVIK